MIHQLHHLIIKTIILLRIHHHLLYEVDKTILDNNMTSNNTSAVVVNISITINQNTNETSSATMIKPEHDSHNTTNN